MRWDCELHVVSGARTPRMHTDASMVDAVRRVDANPNDVDISMYHGFNSNAYQLIGTPWLPLASEAVMFDWSHCYLQDGLADWEFGTFMKAMRAVAIYDELADFVGAYKLPRQYGSLQALFEPHKVKQALKVGKFQCDCSEFATLAPMIGRYLREVAWVSLQTKKHGFCNVCISP